MLVGFFVSSSYAQPIFYRVTYVYDGDTVKLLPINAAKVAEFKLRLTDIDAPERNQAYGLQSRRALIKLCQNKAIIATAQITGTDKYQRSLGHLHCNGVDASYYLAEHGFAWFYTAYSHNAEILQAAQNARQLSLGLWAENNPTPPWLWRHQYSAF